MVGQHGRREGFLSSSCDKENAIQAGSRPLGAAAAQPCPPAAASQVATAAAAGSTPDHACLPPATTQDAQSEQQTCSPSDAEQQPTRQLPPRRFTARSFYGSRLQPGGAAPCRHQQVEDRVLRFLANVQRRMAAGAAGAAPPAWHVFPTQQPAFEAADAQPGLEVFSVEYGREGKRRFIATSRPEFWRRYLDMLPQHRHHYEIIRQGAPCHLYFDLEFQVGDNPGLDGTAAVCALLELVRDQLRDSFRLDLRDEWVLEMDSSTAAKFSRHLIIRLPGAAFASNAHVGALVLRLCAVAKERQGEDARCGLLVVKKGAGDEEALFVDQAVYTRNRAFRLHMSSKCGKQAVLENTGRFGGAGLTQLEFFEASLVTNVPPDARLLRCFAECAEEAAVASAARASRLCAPQPGGAVGGAAGLCYGPCPFPGVEAFVNSICCQGGVVGSVRSWALLDDAGLLILSIRGNRFCGNIGRAHKSNGIFFVVDLREGSWYQKCYDPDCRHYRSPLTPLPPHLLGVWHQPAAATAQACKPLSSPCSACGDGHGCPWACSCDSGAAGGESEDDHLMLQALEQYEQRQKAATQRAGPHPAQQQRQRQLAERQEPQQAGPPAAGGGEAEDAVLLEALLQYEQQAAPNPHAATPWQQQQRCSGSHPGSHPGQTGRPQAVPTPKAQAAVTAPGQQHQPRRLEVWERLL